MTGCFVVTISSEITVCSGAELESIIRCRKWSVEAKDLESDSKFVFEVLCVKKQQKFKFVFEKVSSADPFDLMHTSLSEKIASTNQMGYETSTPAKVSTKVSNKDALNCSQLWLK
jgi:hypothetical protein